MLAVTKNLNKQVVDSLVVLCDCRITVTFNSDPSLYQKQINVLVFLPAYLEILLIKVKGFGFYKVYFIIDSNCIFWIRYRIAL